MTKSRQMSCGVMVKLEGSDEAESLPMLILKYNHSYFSTPPI